MRHSGLPLAFSLLFTMLFILPSHGQESFSLKGKKVGFYISGKNFQLDPTFNLKYAQFLKQGDEDRSYTGKFKNEVIIQLGLLLEQELADLLDTDTSYFMNAIPEYGLNFRAAYDSLEQKLYGDFENLKELDYVLYLENYRVSHRIHRSVFVRSNRMVTERIPVEVAKFSLLLISPEDNKVLKRSNICFDKLTTKVSERHFDFYSTKSPFGKFMGDNFSAWWSDLQGVQSYSCN